MKKNLRWLAACASALVLSTARLSASSPDGEFDVAMVAISSSTWAATKYNKQTGEAWNASDGAWVKIEDEQSLPAGRYVIHMIGLSNDWSVMRLETITGRTWQSRQGKWVEITHAARARGADAPYSISLQESDGKKAVEAGSNSVDAAANKPAASEN